MPGYRMGHELCEALASSGVGWVNLHPETATGLAHLVAGEELAEKGITFLPGQLATAVVEEVYHRLEKEKTLLYFARESYSPGLVRAIASSIGELRYHGVTSDNLSIDSFVSKDKGQDMVALLKAYEHYLADHKFIDTPGMLSYALDSLSKRTSADSDTIYLLPSFLQLAPLERRLIELLSTGRLVISATESESLSTGRLIVLAADPVYGLSRPGMEPVEAPMPEDVSAPLAEVDRLPWLYQIDRSPEPAGDGFFEYLSRLRLLNESGNSQANYKGRDIFRQGSGCLYQQRLYSCYLFSGQAPGPECDIQGGFPNLTAPARSSRAWLSGSGPLLRQGVKRSAFKR